MSHLSFGFVLVIAAVKDSPASALPESSMTADDLFENDPHLSECTECSQPLGVLSGVLHMPGPGLLANLQVQALVEEPERRTCLPRRLLHRCLSFTWS